MVIYNWKQMKQKRRAFDDGSMISIRSQSKSKKYNKVVIHKELLKILGVNSKFVVVFYSEKGFLGFKFVDEEEDDCYSLRTQTSIKFEIRSAMFDYFDNRNYFEGDYKIEDGMVIIKVTLKDEKKTPLKEEKFEFKSKKSFAKGEKTE